MNQPEGTKSGWDQHREDQLRRTASATPLQRLRWLEEAIAFAFRAGAITEASQQGPRVSLSVCRRFDSSDSPSHREPRRALMHTS